MAVLKTFRQKDVWIISFENTTLLADPVVKALEKELLSVVEGKSKIKVVLNMADLQYINSAAIGKIVALQKQVNQLAGALRLCKVPPRVLEMFKATRLDKIFEIHESLEKALVVFERERLHEK